MSARKRTLRQLARQNDVACKGCGTGISAARAACPVAHERCPDCNAPLLKTSQEARERAPQYETLAWERGQRLD